MKQYCRRIEEFDFAEFERRMGVLKDDAERKIMDFFKANAVTFVKVARRVFHDNGCQMKKIGLVVEGFFYGFDDWIEEDIDEDLFNDSKAEFFRDAILVLVSMRFIRTDLPSSFLNEVCELGFGNVEEWLIKNDQYEYWCCDQSKSIDDLKKYVCKILPPGQGEIYFYHQENPLRSLSRTGIYTEYQKELLNVAENNIESFCCIYYDEDGGPILKFLTKNQ